MSSTAYPALATARRLPNLWDIAAILCVFGAIVAVASVARNTLVPLSAPQAVSISLDPWNLPNYAMRTTLRMFAALIASLLFTFTFAPLAAKSRRAALVMIPALDILQSVPILGFLSFTVVFFMGLFPGKVLGLELAAIFAIFTSQAWNMAFSLYQSLKTVPNDLVEATRGFHLTGWQRFWRLEVPFGVPGLVWNMMMSMSGGWFFVVASEAISVGDNTWKLPGIGSYVALALEERDIGAVVYAIAAMLLVIIAVRPAPVPASRRLVVEIPVRDDGGRDGRRSVDAEAAPAHTAAAGGRRGNRRCDRNHRRAADRASTRPPGCASGAVPYD